jgi:V/A-type H+-transporting ATPase subunit E
MSQRELMEAIGQQVLAQRERIMAQANERAATIVRKAEAEKDKFLHAAVTRAAASVKKEEAKIVNEAKLQAKKELLMAKQQLVDDTMGGLETALRELPKRKDYRAVLVSLLDEALEGAEGEVRVRCRTEDRKLVEEHLKARQLKGKVESADLPLGGVDASWGTRGEFIRRNNFASRLEKIRPLLLQEANRIIFGAEVG